jgi:hypothetical protein
MSLGDDSVPLVVEEAYLEEVKRNPPEQKGEGKGS